MSEVLVRSVNLLYLNIVCFLALKESCLDFCVCIFCMQNFQVFVRTYFCKENSVLEVAGFMHLEKHVPIETNFRNCYAYRGERNGPLISKTPKHSPLFRLKSFARNDTKLAKHKMKKIKTPDSKFF